LSLISDVLKDEGYDVETCLNGDCFALIQSFAPDVVLCDYMLPGYDGRTVVQRLRAGLAPDMPFIMISAASYPGTRWRDWSADDFLPKPFDLDRLIAAVDRAVSRDALLWSRHPDPDGRDERAS